MFYKLALFTVGIIWRFWFNLKIYGKDNIPIEGGYILACNHCSAIDPMIFPQGVKRQKIRFMAKAELFDIPVLGTVIRWLGVFPVSRGAGDMSAIETAMSAIEEGKILGLFPEGTRSKDGSIQRFKSGLALISRKTHAGVLPTAITYTGGNKFRSTVVLTYGKFIPFEELNLDSDDSHQLKEATRHLHSVMEELKGMNQPGQ